MTRRLRIGLIAAAVLLSSAAWVIWAVVSSSGQGVMGLGGDFSAYYRAGMIIRDGRGADLYALMEYGGPFLRPPWYAWLFVPFAWFSYPIATMLWMTFTLGSICLGIRLVAGHRWAAPMAWALTFAPVRADITFGQSGGLIFLLFCVVYLLWMRKRLWSAGIVASLLSCKFPLLLGAIMLWLIGIKRDWRALAGIAFGGLILAGFCFAFMPEASVAYARYGGKMLSVIYQPRFQLMSFFSLHGFWLLLLPDRPVWASLLYIGCLILLTLGYIGFLRRQPEQADLRFAATIVFTVLVTPYGYIYDWVVLLLPGVLLWQRRIPHCRESFALVWLGAFWSRIFVAWQLLIWPIAVQVSVPALAAAAVWLYRQSNRESIHP